MNRCGRMRGITASSGFQLLAPVGLGVSRSHGHDVFGVPRYYRT